MSIGFRVGVYYIPAIIRCLNPITVYLAFSAIVLDIPFSEKEVGRMTLKKLLSLYEHYKNNYDFKLKQITYTELEEKINHQGELFSDE